MIESDLDYILNGQAAGSVAQKLLAFNFDVNCLRPFIGKDNRTYLTVNENGKLIARPVMNVTGTLRKEDWILLDTAILAAAQPRLKAVADLRAAGMQYVIPNGLGTTVLQTETQSDIGDATISMDGLREGQNDRPLFDLTNLPLPIIHKDFSYSARQIAASRNGGSPLDTTSAALAARKVAEEAEKLLLGVSDTYKFGGGTIYGYTNLLNRPTATLTSPEDSAWTPETLVSEVLTMRQTVQDLLHYGPYVLYFSSAWDKYLDEDYKAHSDLTLRERLKMIDGLTDVRTLDYLTGYDSILVQMSADVARIIVGMEITTVQWETIGGLLQNFKVMAILVPQLRFDFNKNTGLVHGSVVA